jgi:hypothetical protein
MPGTRAEAALVRGERLDAPTAPAAVSSAPEPEPVPDDAPQSLLLNYDLTFDDLASYRYEYPEDGRNPKKDQIPAKILKLDGKPISIKGFMIPLKVRGEDVTEFVLVRNQHACCFGIVPAMNEWIHVIMDPERFAPYAIDIPITVFGKLEVGESFENGLLMSIYRMQSNQVDEPAFR